MLKFSPSPKAKLLLIRDAIPNDIPAMIVLERRAESAAHWTDSTYQAFFREHAPRRIVLVAQRNESLLGFVVARAVDREWEIENLVVAAEARRQGVGFRLIQELTSQIQAQGGHRIQLEVRNSNSAARALYSKLGFSSSGIRARYYKEPEETAICLSLQLKSST